jgi:hypothetical protein
VAENFDEKLSNSPLYYKPIGFGRDAREHEGDIVGLSCRHRRKSHLILALRVTSSDACGWRHILLHMVQQPKVGTNTKSNVQELVIEVKINCTAIFQ